MRMVAKTASWSVTHMIVAISVAFALTRDWRAALAVGLIEPVFQTAAYALHERAWAKGLRRSRADSAADQRDSRRLGPGGGLAKAQPTRIIAAPQARNP